jgi:hypothetical protein
MESVDLRKTGELAAKLVLPGSDWVHRRVQRVAYRDSRLLINRLSVDFTVPEAGAYIPVSVLPKWPPVYRLDFERADGSPVPLLTSIENGLADEGLMFALAAEATPVSLEDREFNKALKSLCCGPETHLEESFNGFRDRLVEDPADPKVERLLDLAAMLTDATLLWYPVEPSEIGQRTVCKLEYLIRNFESERVLRRVARSLSWSFPADYIPLWHIGADANFHVDIEAPSVLEIRSLQTRYFWFGDPPADSGGEPDADTKQAEEVELRPEEYTDIEGGLAHVYVSGRRPLGADLITTFAPSPGVVASMFGAALLIAILVAGFYHWRGAISQPDNVDAAVSVLILIPALIGYIVNRPSDPPHARRFLFGVQMLSLAASAVPLLMAVLLLRYAGDNDCLQRAWLGPLITSWAITGCLLFSWIRAARSGDEETEDNQA